MKSFWIAFEACFRTRQGFVRWETLVVFRYAPFLRLRLQRAIWRQARRLNATFEGPRDRYVPPIPLLHYRKWRP